MALIKGSQSSHITPHGTLNLHDLKEEAEQALAEARAEAKRLVAEARAEAQARIDQAIKDGYAQGHDQGHAQGREAGLAEGRAEALETYSAQLQAVLRAWSEALTDWEERRDVMLAAAREDVLVFALAMGAKVAHRVIESDPQAVADQVAETLALVVGPTGVTVSVHPEDRPLIESVLGELVGKLGQCTHAELREDPQISRGGCVVTTGRGRIDATIEKQIERICQTLLGRATLHPPLASPAGGQAERS